MAGQSGWRRFTAAGIVFGGVVLGAGGFGLYRVASAEPLPDPLPPVKLDPPPAPLPTVPAPPSAIVLPPLPALPAVELNTPAPLPTPALPTPALPTVQPVSDVLPVIDLAVPKLPDVKLPVAPKPAALPQPAAPTLPALPVVADKPDFKLQPVSPLPNLNTGAKAPPSHELPPPRTTGIETLPKPTKVGDELAPMPLPVVEKLPAVQPPVAPAPGAAPMTLPTKQAVLSAALGVALAVSPAAKARADEPMKSPVAVKTPLEELQDEVKKLKDELKTVKDDRDRLVKEVRGLPDGKAILDTEKGLMQRVKDLEEKRTRDLDDLDKSAKKLTERLTKLEENPPRTAGSSPLTGTGKGAIRLVNEFKTKLSIVVNDKSYPLDPSEVKEFPVPAGVFRYTLVEFGDGKPVSSDIKDGETVTLRIK